MKYLLLLFFCATLLSCEKFTPAPASNYTCTLDSVNPELHPSAERFQALLEENLSLTPGLQAAIVDQQGQTWTGAVGYADLATRTQLQPCHRMLVASISKVVTATIIHQLQEENVLNMEDQISTWLSEDLIGEIDNANQVTIRQLLNHTSGLYDYLNIRQTLNTFNQPFFKETQVEKLQYTYGQDAYHAPGADFTYSNTNYLLLGLIIEAATGQTLAQAVDRRITAPLGLQHFSMGTEETPLPDDVARPYMAILGGQYVDISETAVSDAATGDGGVLSNMLDLTTYINGVFDGTLLSPAGQARLTEEFVLTGEDQADFDEWPEEAYGLGITRYNTPFGVAYGHTGFAATYSSILLYFPENGSTLALISSGIDLQDADNFTDRSKALRDDMLALLFQ